MINEIVVYISNSLCPYYNLSAEEALAENLKDNQAILYLWQNADTVVIGRHQNAYLECNYEIMKEDEISLARRRTGGGAVFHDERNLNFTFINTSKDYDLARNQRIIGFALEDFGLQCKVSGRNDITYQGRKFSGNAYYQSKNYCIHHGTIMLDVDIGKLEKYLNVDKLKLLSKGVASVRSRVINLRSVAPEINIVNMRQALIGAFEKEYTQKAGIHNLEDYKAQIDDLRAYYASKENLFGDFPIVISKQRKPYGEIVIAKVKDKLTIYSDCLDIKIVEYIKSALERGNKVVDIKKKLTMEKQQIIKDINTMLMEVD